jgi:hypothetical protein
LSTLLDTFSALRRTSRRQWQQLLGELRSMAPALHSTRYLFLILQHVLVDQRYKRVRLNQLVKQLLKDWAAIAQQVSTVPIPLADLVPMPPDFIGATGASQDGMGSFWVATTAQ